jgi:GTP-binding protein EngB required for normal cell division
MHRVLEPALANQLSQTRDLLSSVRDALTDFGAAAADQTALASSIRQLDELFLLVVVGEFNAGKSAFINALLGHQVLEEGVTPTTAQIHLLIYGDAIRRETRPDGLEVVAAPAELLRDVHIVDTPGTNAIFREHERITAEFVPRSDFVLFVTSADRPFTESERLFLAAVRDWGKTVVIILNKIDILSSPSEVEKVVDFVRNAGRDLLGYQPDVVPVSARLASRAKQGDPSQWAASRFESFEKFLLDRIDAPARFRLKLANPLGVGQALATRYSGIAGQRLALMQEDLGLLADIERQLALYREDLARGFELRMAAVEKVLADMEVRGHRYFEDTLRIGRVIDLLNRARIQKDFQDVVVADAPALIERAVNELIDWHVDQEFRQWQAVTAKLVERQRQHASRMLGAPEVGSFHTDRTRLIDSVGRQAQRVVATYDKQREGETIADQARVAVAASAAAGGAALGLGTLVTVAASTVAVDVTGILLASLVLGVGFLIIPARRRRAKATLQEKLTSLRERLTAALTTEFARAQELSAQRLQDLVAPYGRFVRAEEARWREAEQSLTSLQQRTAALLSQIDKRT